MPNVAESLSAARLWRPPPYRSRSGAPSVWSGAGDRRSFATQLLVIEVVLLLGVVAPSWALAVGAAQTSARAEAITRARTLVVTLTHDRELLEDVVGPDPEGTLEAPVERLRLANDIGFLVVMSPAGVRYTHPDPEQVGRQFQGTITGAQRGQITVEDYTGTLGRSVRVVAPARDASGEIVALISAGVPLTSITNKVRASALQLGLLALGALAVGTLGAALLARRLRRQTYGLGPVGLARLQTYYDALLHSVSAGLVLVGNDQTVVLCNDEACRMLDVPLESRGVSISSLGLDAGLGELMASGRGCDGEVFATASRTLVVTQVPAVLEGTALGWVTTIADRTDLVRLTGELDSLRSFTQSLSARAHESDNRLHTVSVLVEIGEYEQAVSFATAALAVSQALTLTVTTAVKEPALAALLLGKAAQADERGVHLELVPGTLVPVTGIAPGDLVVVAGNLLDNAIDAAADAPGAPWVRFGGRLAAGELVLEVADSGPGVGPALIDQAFTRGWTTKPVTAAQDRPQGRGLGLSLVDGTVRRLGGTIEVQSEPESQFVVRLPVQRRVRLEPAELPQETP